MFLLTYPSLFAIKVLDGCEFVQENPTSKTIVVLLRSTPWQVFFQLLVLTITASRILKLLGNGEVELHRSESHKLRDLNISHTKD